MQAERTELYVDVNVKARCRNLEWIEQTLLKHAAVYVGEDFQTDTFFAVDVGKMKLREGNIENLITHYLREEIQGEWRTRVFLYETFPTAQRRKQLLDHLVVLRQVKKRRKIFLIDNVKFHLDTFENGDRFVEIEAIDRSGEWGIDYIQKQAAHYKELLAIHANDVLTQSYIDLLR